MRTEKGISSSAGASQQVYFDRATTGILMDSPPRHDIWSTERRLAMKPPPGAPVKAPRSSRPYLPNYSPFQSACSFDSGNRTCGVATTTNEAANSSSNDRTRILPFILPSKTIDEDDDHCMAVSLPFRPTRLSFTFSSEEQVASDPTTVLLGPTTTCTTPGGVLSWHDDDAASAYMDQDDDDVSPRLFHRFGESTLWRYESMEMAEDESDAIFRSSADDDNDDHDHNTNYELVSTARQERFTSSPLLRGKDDVRI
jgi:hypothetical protein